MPAASAIADTTWRRRPAPSAGRLHPPGSRPDRVDDRGGEHLPRARLSAPFRPGGLARRTAARGRRAGGGGRGYRSRYACRIASAAPRNRWWRSAARLAAKVELLVLDEPTASLPANEVARLFASLRRLRARGVGMIYVSHRLDEVFEIADRIVVLRDGRVVGERVTADTTPEEVILLIVGREPSQVFRRPAQRERRRAAGIGWRDGRRCRADRLPAPRRARSSAWSGCAAPGRKASAARCSGWRRSPAAASCSMASRSRRLRRAPGDAPKASTWSAPTARRTRSCPISTCAKTCYLNPALAAVTRPAHSSGPGSEHDDAFRLGHEIGLRPNDPELPIEWLSGGNQQKVVLGRWLHLQGKIYVFEDPDRRRRCRRQGRDLPFVRRGAEARRRDPVGLHRFRGSRKGLPPRAGVRSRPRRRRARRRARCPPRTCSAPPPPASARSPRR